MRRSKSRKKKQAPSKESRGVAIRRRSAIYRMTSDIDKKRSATLAAEKLQVLATKGGRRTCSRHGSECGKELPI